VKLLAPLWVAAPVTAAAGAPDFAVDYQIDAADVEPGDGLCRDQFGFCTLRAAIQEANAQPGQQTISLGPIVHYMAIYGADEDAAATGDLDVSDDLIIEGADASTTIVQAETIDRLFDVAADVNLTLSDVRSREAQSYDAGGGLRAGDGAFVVLARTVFERNLAVYEGGAVALLGDAVGGATLLAVESRFAQNTAGIEFATEGAGGAIHASGHAAMYLLDCSLEANVADDGAAIYTAFGGVTIERSTIANHQSEGATLRLANGEPVRVVNSTIADNQSEFAIWTAAGTEPTTFENTTIAGNVAPYAILNAFSPPFAYLRFRDSVLFDSVTVGECTEGESLGHNAVADGAPGYCATWGPTDLLVADPGLAPLADNGGATRTRMPLASSPLRDAGDDANCPALDQRRQDRPQDGDGDGVAHCDIGAVEAPEPDALALAIIAGMTLAGVYRLRRSTSSAKAAAIVAGAGSGA
jgi:hypothetical protein